MSIRGHVLLLSSKREECNLVEHKSLLPQEEWEWGWGGSEEMQKDLHFKRSHKANASFAC